jgi:hypothetical protein
MIVNNMKLTELYDAKTKCVALDGFLDAITKCN